MSCLSDNETLGLPTMLPTTLMSSQLSPTGGSVNFLDMINQDVMLGNNLIGAAMSSASTEVTYASHYTATSAAPFTSAGDVFLPSMPITTISNTFVKPLPVFVAPTIPCRTAKNVMNPNPKSASRSANPRPEKSKTGNLQSSSEGLSSTAISNQDQMVRNPFAAKTHRESSSSRKSSKSSSKKSSSRSHSSHSKSSSRRSSSKKCSRSRTKSERSLLLSNLHQQSAFVPESTRGGFTRSTTTHTVTTPADSPNDSIVGFGTEPTHTTTIAAQAASQRAVTEAKSSLRTATVTSHTASKTQSPATGLPGTFTTFLCPDSSTTTTLTSFTASRPRTPASIISPMQSTYTIPTNILYSTPTIISRTPPASPATDRASEQFDLLSSQTFAVPANVAARASPTSTPDSASRLRTRLIIPVTLSTFVTSAGTATTAKIRHTHSSRCSHSGHAVTNALTTNTVTTTSATRTLNHGAFSLPPGATFYTRKIAAGRAQSRTIAVTTESQTFAIADGKGSYTTLTISSDFTTNSCNPLGVATTQSSTSVTHGHTHTSSITSDSPMARPRNQLLIPIANSHMNTSTSLGYLVTSPIGSEIITTRNSAATTHSATVATSISSHTITTINSETLNRIRSRLIIPISHNVPSTVAGLGTVPSSTNPTDSNRTRGPVTIIANQLISAATTRENTDHGTTTPASNVTASIRNMYSVSPSQSLFPRCEPLHTPATTAVDSAARTINRMIIPVMQATSNSQSPAPTASDSSNSTRAFSAAPTQTTYIIATDMRSSPDEDLTRSSRMVIHSIHNTNAVTVASTPTVATPTTRQPFATDGTVHMSPKGSSDSHSTLRSRLIVHVTTAESPTPGTSVPITAYALTRARAPHSAFAIPARPSSFSSTRPSEVITRSPATMTLITFASSTADSHAASSAHKPLASSAAHGEPAPVTCTITTPTPTLANTGNRFVIKLATTPSASPTASVSSVTSAVTTPITTATVNPLQHEFLEPQPVSRPRTFPGPRTYSVAQRSGGRKVVQRAPPKKMITPPAPLQIFADVVCPPMAAQSHGTVHPKPRFTLSHSSGNSTLVHPQYKNTVFKNLSTIAHPNPERASSTFLAPRSSSERLVLNRPVALVSPRRAAPSTQAVIQNPSTTSTVMQGTFTRSLRVSRIIPDAAADSAAPSISSDPSPSLFDQND